MDRTVLNHYRLFLRTLEKHASTLLHRLQAAWSAENMSAILDHFEEGMEKTGWSPEVLESHPETLAAIVKWMQTWEGLPPALLPSITGSETVSGIVGMAQVFQSYSPTALTRLQKEAHAFEGFLENPEMGYAESRARWG